MTPAEYGNFGTFYSWLNIITVFVTLQLYLGVYTQGLVKFEADQKVFSSSLQGLTLFMILVWLAVYLIDYPFWNNLFSLTTVQMLCMFVMIWTAAVFQFWASEQRVSYKYRNLVIVSTIISVLKPVVGIVFVLLANDKVTARVLSIALVELIGYFGLFLCQMKRGKKFYSKRYWKYALRINLPLVPHYLSSIVLNSSDRIMIKNMVGPDVAGIYSLAYAVSQIMILFNTALSQTISPWMYKHIKNRTVTHIAPIMYLTMYGIAGVNLLLILVAPDIVSIFAPPSYHEAIWVIPPVALSVVMMYSYDFFARFEFYYEKTKFVMFASVMGAFLNVVLNYIFIQKYGYMAAGYTTLVCYSVYVACHYWNMSKICAKEFPGIHIYNAKKLLIFFMIVIIAGLSLMLTYNYPIIRYCILGAVVCAMVYKRKYIITKLRIILNLRTSQPTGNLETNYENQ